jgi:hypothetical protein
MPAIFVAGGIALAALPSAADVAPRPRTLTASLDFEEPARPVETPRPREDRDPATRVVVVDVASLPKGELPALPAENDAPTAVPAWTQPASIAVQSLGEVERPRRPSKKSIFTPVKKPSAQKRTQKVKLVSITPSTPTVDAIYAPSPEITELSGESAHRMSCGDSGSIIAMRWESLSRTADGDARLDLRDLWFDGKSCAVGPGPEASVTLRAIAWQDGKPWLFAMQSRAGVTLIMPKVADLSSESMVGTPVSMRGDFTRITLPLGRYGSASIVAQVESLGPPGESGSSPVEVGIEMVQTMSEKAPTLLVRTRRALPEDEGRD